MGGGDASTGRRSRPEGVTFNEGSTALRAENPLLGTTRARSSARSADERLS